MENDFNPQISDENTAMVNSLFGGAPLPEAPSALSAAADSPFGGLGSSANSAQAPVASASLASFAAAPVASAAPLTAAPSSPRAVNVNSLGSARGRDASLAQSFATAAPVSATPLPAENPYSAFAAGQAPAPSAAPVAPVRPEPAVSEPARPAHSASAQQPPYSSHSASAQQTPPAANSAAASLKQPQTLTAIAIAVALSVVVTSAVILGGFKLGAFNTFIPTGQNIAEQYATQQAAKAFSREDGSTDWSKLYAEVSAQVVSIEIQTTQGGALGSGFILDTDGHIVTNNHVIEGAEQGQIHVSLSDGRIIEAKVVGTDPTTDVALIKLVQTPSDLKPVKLGDSENVIVGSEVIAIGNPLGLSSTATTGIVSAINRPVTASTGGITSASSGGQVVTDAIQIDAAINPGNSGGPLFNNAGEVIGITSSIATTGGGSGSIGIGFAIPSNLTKMITDQLVSTGAADHPALGVMIQDGTVNIDGADYKAVVVKDYNGTSSPAKDAGIKPGDAIIGVDNKPIVSTYSLIGHVREQKMNSVIKVTYVREGKKYEVNVTLNKKQDVQQAPAVPATPKKDDESFDPFEFFFGQR